MYEFKLKQKIPILTILNAVINFNFCTQKEKTRKNERKTTFELQTRQNHDKIIRITTNLYVHISYIIHNCNACNHLYSQRHCTLYITQNRKYTRANATLSNFILVPNVIWSQYEIHVHSKIILMSV